MKYLLLIVSVIGFSKLGISQEDSKVIVEGYQKLSPNEAVRCIFIDKENFKWLGTDRGLYRMINLENDPELIVTDSITAITEDKKQLLWYGNRNLLLSSEDLSQKIFLNQAKGDITCMNYFNGDIWVGTTEGLYRVSDDQSRILNHYNTKNSKLKSNAINMLYLDTENKLWVGTDAGVAVIDQKDWDYYEADHKITGAINTGEGVWLLAEKKMWLIYKEDGRDRWQDAAVKRGLSRGPVRALAADSKGRIYVASEILVQFDPVTDKALQIDEDYGFVSSQTLSLKCDKNDDLWVGTADRGLFKMDMIDSEDEKFTVVAFSKGEIKCPNDKTASIILVVNGGKTPYRYQWSDPSYKGSKLDSIGGGTYSVTVTDAEGEEYIANVAVKAPEPLQMELVSKQAVSELNRKDGKATIKITGGTEPYRTLWSNGKSGLIVGNLSGGKHTVKIADKNHCQMIGELYIEQPKVLPELIREKIVIGQTLRINELYFLADSAIISDESNQVLDEIRTFLKSNPDISIEIGGHTNGTPSHEYCDRLSNARAKNVAYYLYNKGVPEAQISYKGYGKRVPIASNDTQSGRQKNQRVEIKIVSIKQG
jgi:outer membrane protein OmpA-like peptidoglycan-associated protein